LIERLTIADLRRIVSSGNNAELAKLGNSSALAPLERL